MGYIPSPEFWDELKTEVRRKAFIVMLANAAFNKSDRQMEEESGVYRQHFINIRKLKSYYSELLRFWCEGYIKTHEIAKIIDAVKSEALNPSTPSGFACAKLILENIGFGGRLKQLAGITTDMKPTIVLEGYETNKPIDVPLIEDKEDGSTDTE